LSLIVGAYLAVLLGIGWWCHRTRISGMTDFLLAGRRLGVPLCAAAMAATHFGGGAVMGGASYGFEHGLSGAWYGIATGVGLLLLALLTAHRFRSLALYTVPDYLEQRYGSRSLRILGATLSLVALVGILAAQVSAARSAEVARTSALVGGVALIVLSVFPVIIGMGARALGGLLWEQASAAAALTALVVGSTIAMVGVATGADIGGVPVEVIAALVSAAAFVVVTAVRPRANHWAS
jgi:SSS family solute:Na+ symporter